MDMTAMEESGLADADLISVPEAARHIGLHVDTLYRLCRTGRFPPAFQIGARWNVSVPRLARYLHGDMTEPLARSVSYLGEFDATVKNRQWCQPVAENVGRTDSQRFGEVVPDVRMVMIESLQTAMIDMPPANPMVRDQEKGDLPARCEGGR
jgi:hypothetical protein